MLCFLNAVYDFIFALLWFSAVGLYAFSASGEPVNIRDMAETPSWKFPTTSLLLLLLPPLQFYSGLLGYRIFKSMQPPDDGLGPAQVGMLDRETQPGIDALGGGIFPFKNIIMFPNKVLGNHHSAWI